jgi:hypothetical protein
MYQTWSRFGVLAVIAVLAIGALVNLNRVQPAFGGADQKAANGPHYTVVETEGHNLVVTDNQSNTLYFYTVDKGKAPGSELKLRAKVDLTKVGQPSIMPVDINIQK